MTVLFLTDSLDVHCDAAKWALAQRGIDASLWCLDLFPAEQTLSSRIRPDVGTSIQIDLDERSLMTDFSSIWIRRLPEPQSVSPRLNQADVPMALNEADKLASGLRPLIGKNPIWVNPIESRRLSALKPVQLVAAKKVGWKIPDTLLSNDPEDIRAFYREHRSKIIYKTFNQAYWRNSNTGTVSAFYASKVPENLVYNDVALKCCPGIYQQYIDKHSEIRATFFGHAYVAVRIYSQDTEKGVTDWRSDLKHEARMEPIELPCSVYDKCIAFMNEMNIVHGSFDIVQTPESEYVFLEMNEMGQFLWLEERIPQIPALDMFVSFALNPSSTFKYEPTRERSGRAYSDYLTTTSFQAFRQRLTEAGERGANHYKLNYVE